MEGELLSTGTRWLPSLPSPSPSHCCPSRAVQLGLPGECPCQAGLQRPQINSIPHPVPASLLQDCLYISDFSFLARVSPVPRAAGCERCPTAACTGNHWECQDPPVPSCWHQLGGVMPSEGKDAVLSVSNQPPAPKIRVPLHAPALLTQDLLGTPVPHSPRSPRAGLGEDAPPCPCHPLRRDKGSSKGLQPSSDMQDLPGRSVDTMISVFVMLNSPT